MQSTCLFCRNRQIGCCVGGAYTAVHNRHVRKQVMGSVHARKHAKVNMLWVLSDPSMAAVIKPFYRS